MMNFTIYDFYEGSCSVIGTAHSWAEAEQIMLDYYNDTDDEANLFAKAEDGRVFVLGYKGNLQEVK